MKKQAPVDGSFSKRLITIRKQRGLTQEELGQLIGVSKRVIAYYETESEYPPIHLTSSLAEQLKVSADELLGLRAVKKEMTPEELSVWRRFRKVQELSVRDQKTVYALIRALVTRRRLRAQPE